MKARDRDPNLHYAVSPRDNAGRGHNKSAPPLSLCPLAVWANRQRELAAEHLGEQTE